VVNLQVSGRASSIRAHRIVFALAHGHWPADDLDHENRDRGANQIENLRDVTRGQNLQNVGLRANNTSGVKGVSWRKEKRKWRSRIDADERSLNLGDFKTFSEASDVRWAAEMVMHPFRPKPEPVDPVTIIPDGVIVTGCWSIEGKTCRVPKMDKPTAMTSSTTVFTYDEVAYR
jgi:hypothetical protein